jgi:hypothetical protein
MFTLKETQFQRVYILEISSSARSNEKFLSSCLPPLSFEC